jgi:hypothetical protein
LLGQAHGFIVEPPGPDQCHSAVADDGNHGSRRSQASWKVPCRKIPRRAARGEPPGRPGTRLTVITANVRPELPGQQGRMRPFHNGLRCAQIPCGTHRPGQPWYRWHDNAAALLPDRLVLLKLACQAGFVISFYDLSKPGTGPPFSAARMNPTRIIATRRTPYRQDRWGLPTAFWAAPTERSEFRGGKFW